ncbi:three-helix bundle dimerization domain-containing protein [Rhodococcus sp. C26F]
MNAQPVDQEIHGLERAVHTLTREFAQVPAPEIRRLVARVRGDFAGHPIREFVPLFVERRVRQMLKDRHAP